MRLFTISCGPLDVNCYLLAGENKEAFAVDPAEFTPVRDALEQNGLTLTHILLTHGHFDHIAGVPELKAHTGAKVCIHADDAPMLLSDEKSLAFLQNLHIPPVQADVLLRDNDEFEAAGLHVAVIHTPGHTPGGICYLLQDERVIFTGDTLFRLGAGRADFPGSDEVALYRSIRDRLFTLPGDYTLYPGHMRPSSMEVERAHNTFMRYYGGNGW